MARSISDTGPRLKAVLSSRAMNRQIFRALLSLASAALLIRMTGLLNQVVVSSRFGAGPRMDAYFIASAVPILMASLLASAIESSVIPIYLRVRTQGTKEEAFRLFSTLLNLLILSTALITLVMLLFRSQVVILSAPGSLSSTIALAASLTPFIFPAFALMAVISYLECILNAEGQFGWPAYAGMLVPLTTAVFVFTTGRAIGIVMLCVGMIAGLCLQLGVFLIRAYRAGLAYRLVLDIRIPEIGLILKAALPVLVAALIGQATNLIDLIFSSFLPSGSISALNYALKLTSVFTGVIFVSVGRAILPYLSRQASANNMTGFKNTLRLYIWIVGIGTTVLSVLAVVLAHPVVHILFQRGAFTATDANRTAITFIGFALGLTPIALVFIVLRAFSALGKTGVFLRITLCSLLLNAIFDYIFSRIWQSEGIALSTSAAFVCTMFILFFILHRTIGELHIFTPPSEIVDVLRKVGKRLGFSQRKTRSSPVSAASSVLVIPAKESFPMFSIPYRVQRQITRFGIIILVFAAGVAGVFLNSLYALRISLASIILFALMRYNYLLLIIWVLINGPNAMPIFRGSNILIGLTAPTLLLMTSMPVKQTLKRLPALSFLAVYLLEAAATIAVSPFGLGPSLTAWVLSLDCLAVSILAINVLNTRRRLLVCIDIFLLLSVGIALYGIYSFITRQNGIVDSYTSLFRTFSIFNTAGGLALFLALVIPLALYRTFTLQGILRIISLIGVFIFLVAAVLTFSRAEYISIPVSIAVMAWLVPSRQMRNALLSGVCVVVVVMILLTTIGNVPLLSRFASSDIATLNGRTILWQAVLSNFDATHLLGNGIRASDVLLINLHVGGIAGQGGIGTSPSDLFVGTLYDEGIIGLLLIILVFLALTVNLVAGMRKASGERRMLFVVALAVLASVVIHSLNSNDFWDQAISVYIWIIMVLPFALCWTETEKEDKSDADSSNMPTEPRLQAIGSVERERVALT